MICHRYKNNKNKLIVHTLTFSKITSGPATPETVLYSVVGNKRIRSNQYSWDYQSLAICQASWRTNKQYKHMVLQSEMWDGLGRRKHETLIILQDWKFGWSTHQANIKITTCTMTKMQSLDEWTFTCIEIWMVWSLIRLYSKSTSLLSPKLHYYIKSTKNSFFF